MLAQARRWGLGVAALPPPLPASASFLVLFLFLRRAREKQRALPRREPRGGRARCRPGPPPLGALRCASAGRVRALGACVFRAPKSLQCTLLAAAPPPSGLLVLSLLKLIVDEGFVAPRWPLSALNVLFRYRTDRRASQDTRIPLRSRPPS